MSNASDYYCAGCDDCYTCEDHICPECGAEMSSIKLDPRALGCQFDADALAMFGIGER